MRVPGLMGSLGAGGGPPESSAIVVPPEAAIVLQPVSCCKLEESQFLLAAPTRQNRLNRALTCLIFEPFSFDFHPSPSSDISQGLSRRRLLGKHHDGLLGHRWGCSDQRLGPRFPHGGRPSLSAGLG